MGIDEIALRKGKGDFALILTNLDMKEVVIDMWSPYDTVCAELLTQATITADLFHVIQVVNRELKQLKNQQKNQDD